MRAGCQQGQARQKQQRQRQPSCLCQAVTSAGSIAAGAPVCAATKFNFPLEGGDPARQQNCPCLDLT